MSIPEHTHTDPSEAAPIDAWGEAINRWDTLHNTILDHPKWQRALGIPTRGKKTKTEAIRTTARATGV